MCRANPFFFLQHKKELSNSTHTHTHTLKTFLACVLTPGSCHLEKADTLLDSSSHNQHLKHWGNNNNKANTYIGFPSESSLKLKHFLVAAHLVLIFYFNKSLFSMWRWNWRQRAQRFLSVRSDCLWRVEAADVVLADATKNCKPDFSPQRWMNSAFARRYEKSGGEKKEDLKVLKYNIWMRNSSSSSLLLGQGQHFFFCGLGVCNEMQSWHFLPFHVLFWCNAGPTFTKLPLDTSNPHIFHQPSPLVSYAKLQAAKL